MFKYRFTRSLVLVGVILSIITSSAVFSLLAQDAGAEPEDAINFTLSEYKIEIEGQGDNSALELETGKEYTLHFTNGGTLTHEVLIGSDPIVIADNYHHDFANLLLADVEVSITGEMNGAEFAIGVAGLNEFEINPGQEMTITFTLPDDKVGEWEMGCFVSLDPNAPEDDPGAGHYDVGMHIPVTVVAGMAS